MYSSAIVLYDLFINKSFQNCKVKLLILGIRGASEFNSSDFESDLTKDIDRIRFSKNVELYENVDPMTIDDYLKGAEKFSFNEIRANKVLIKTMKVEDVTKDYIGDFINN